MASIVSINISEQKGTAKRPVPEALVDERGVVGDAHAGPWHRQVSLLSAESLARFGRESSRTFAPGDFAENLTTQGLDLSRVAIRDRLTSGTVVLEVTQIGKDCHGGACSVFKEVGRCVMPHEGVFARVLAGGRIRAGDAIAHEPRPLRVVVITLSDRASRGEYEDRSGPAIEAAVAAHFAGKPWHLAIAREVLPDEPEALRRAVQAARAGNADILFTTGGTGIGPRDITPDVVAPLLDRNIPGIMEYIRAKHGASIPSALLSRGVAGVMGSCLVYTLPGSPRAVQEYLAEIFRSLEHAMLMIMGVDAH